MSGEVKLELGVKVRDGGGSACMWRWRVGEAAGCDGSDVVGCGSEERGAFKRKKGKWRRR